MTPTVRGWIIFFYTHDNCSIPAKYTALNAIKIDIMSLLQG